MIFCATSLFHIVFGQSNYFLFGLLARMMLAYQLLQKQENYVLSFLLCSKPKSLLIFFCIFFLKKHLDEEKQVSVLTTCEIKKTKNQKQVFKPTFPHLITADNQACAIREPAKFKKKVSYIRRARNRFSLKDSKFRKSQCYFDCLPWAVSCCICKQKRNIDTNEFLRKT